MKISTLLGDAEFFQGNNTNVPAAKIAVLLPIYDFSSKILKEVIESILCQKEVDFELILLAEGHLSGEIREYIFYCLSRSNTKLFLFKNKLNLPPVSFYYGYLKSSAKYLIFSNQDFVFTNDVLKQLYFSIENSQYKVVFGIAKDSEIKEFNKIPDIRYLNSQNIFSLSTAIVHRDVFQFLGFFDPHPLLYFYFDWDFWLRVAEEYPIMQTNIFVGEARKIQYDTTLWDKCNSEYCARNIMKINRNENLSQSNFFEFELFRSFGEEVDAIVRPYIEEMKAEIVKQKNLDIKCMHSVKNNPRKILILSPKEPSPFYPFFALKEIAGIEVIFDDLSSGIKSKDLTSTDFVIINRYLFDFLTVIEKLNQLGIPWVYFIDDNFILLSQEGYLKGFEWYTYDNLRTHLSTASAVFVSTEALKEEYEKEALHSRLLIFRPTISYALLQSSSKFFKKKAHPSCFYVAMVGGAFRYKHFIEVVLPALITLSKDIDIMLWSICDIPDSIVLPKNLHVKKIWMQADYQQFIFSLANLSLDCVVHPYGETGDIPYKTDAVILMARYINANIIVGNEPCFSMISEDSGILKAENTVQSFYEAFLKLTDESIKLHKMKEEIAYCELHYSQEWNKKQLNDFMKTIPPVSIFDIERREMKIAKHFFEFKAEKFTELGTGINPIQNNQIKWLFRNIIKKMVSKIRSYLIKCCCNE